MTTTTIEIRYGRATLGPDATSEQAEIYDRALTAAVSAAYPGSEVSVRGERSDLTTTVTGVDEDEREAIRDLANRTWETWCRGDADDVSPMSREPFCGCGRRVSECDGSRRSCQRPAPSDPGAPEAAARITYSVRVVDGDGTRGTGDGWDVDEIDDIDADDAEEALDDLETWARVEAAGLSDYADGGTLTLYVYAPDGGSTHRTIALDPEES